MEVAGATIHSAAASSRLCSAMWIRIEVRSQRKPWRRYVGIVFGGAVDGGKKDLAGLWGVPNLYEACRQPSFPASEGRQQVGVRLENGFTMPVDVGELPLHEFMQNSHNIGMNTNWM